MGNAAGASIQLEICWVPFAGCERGWCTGLLVGDPLCPHACIGDGDKGRELGQQYRIGVTCHGPQVFVWTANVCKPSMRYVKISALCSFLCKPLPSSVDMLKSRQSGIGLDHAPHVLPGLGMFMKCFNRPSLAFSCQASAFTMPDKIHLRSLQHA